MASKGCHWGQDTKDAIWMHNKRTGTPLVNSLEKENIGYRKYHCIAFKAAELCSQPSNKCFKIHGILCIPMTLRRIGGTRWPRHDMMARKFWKTRTLMAWTLIIYIYIQLYMNYTSTTVHKLFKSNLWT